MSNFLRDKGLFLDTARLSPQDLAECGLSHNPFAALVVPRPIGWISTLSEQGVPNLAPFSFFNAVSQSPPMVMFCANATHVDGGPKDSLKNARATGEFVANLVTWDLRWNMNVSSAPAPRGQDEFDVAGLTKAPCVKVKPPRVAESPVSLECVVVKVVALPPAEDATSVNTATFGRVVGMHIDSSLLSEGRVDIRKARPIARLGYLDYALLGDFFEMPRPAWPVQDAARGVKSSFKG